MSKLFSFLFIATIAALLFNTCFSQSLDPIPESSHAGCLSYRDSVGLYIIQACPIYSGARIIYPVSLTNEMKLSFPNIDDGYNITDISFPVFVYGASFTRVAVSTNGVLMFGSSPSSSLYNLPIPSSSFAGGAGPVIEPLQSDMVLLAAYSNITTGFIGISPNRIFVVRYTRITAYYTQSGPTSPFFSFDVWFYQNASSTFQIRYHRLDAPITAASPAFSIGAQSADITRYAAIFSSSSNYTAIRSQLLGNTLTFTNSTLAPPMLDPIPPSSHANCLSYRDSVNYYNVQACPIYSGVQIVFPVSLTGESAVSFSSVDDGVTVLNMAFNVSIYGYSSNRVAISTNGLLMFGPFPSSSFGEPIPSSYYAGGAGPVIEPLQSDLYVLPISNITTGFIGVSPNRIFVVRYNRLTTYNQRLLANPALFSFDIYLFQNSTTFQIRYHRLDVFISAPGLSVGIQGTDVTRYVAVFSSSTDMTAINSALAGNILSFTPGGAPITSSSSTGGVARPSSSSTGSAGPVTDPIPASSHANCLSYPDSVNYYNVQACPIYSGVQTVYPVSLTTESAVVFADNDDSATRVALPFPVTVYGNVTSSVGVGTNGLLTFGPTLNGLINNVPIPSSAVINGVGPVIEPLQGDLYLRAGVSNITTGFIGSSPNRVFVVRYNRLTTYNANTVNPLPLYSFDVMLFQNSSAFQIRYYRLDTPPPATIATYFSVGIQANDITRYVAVFSFTSNVAAISSALLGNTLSFTPLNTPVLSSTGSTSFSSTGGGRSSSSAAPDSSSSAITGLSAESSSADSATSSAISSIPIPETSSSSSAAMPDNPTSSSSSATPVPDPEDSSDESGSGLSGGAVAGVIFGCVLGVIIIVLILVYTFYKMKWFCYSENTGGRRQNFMNDRLMVFKDDQSDSERSQVGSQHSFGLSYRPQPETEMGTVF